MTDLEPRGSSPASDRGWLAAHGKELAAFLRGKREDLVVRWERRVLEDPVVAPAATRLSEPLLRDDIPVLIEALARGLEEMDARPASSSDWAIGVASEHARARIEADYTLEAALHELAHFRSALVELFYAERVLPTGVATSLISASIDEAMTIVATHMHAAEQERFAALHDRFTAILGHDLRNPLNAVMLSSSALLRGGVSEAQSEHVRRISRAAKRMVRMIGDLLDFASARLVREGIILYREPSLLADLCREAIDELRLAHPARSIVIEGSDDGRGSWDRHRLVRLVSNLLGNALSYSPPDTEVRVVIAKQGERMVVGVHNEGAPIEPATLGVIFDPFRRGSRAVVKDGLGLGLFIAREIARAHGGDIRVESTATTGTTFIMELPTEAGATQHG